MVLFLTWVFASFATVLPQLFIIVVDYQALMHCLLYIYNVKVRSFWFYGVGGADPTGHAGVAYWLHSPLHKKWVVLQAVV
jgi:hypothetical protein